MAVTLFVTQFTQVSRHFWVNSRKQKEMVRENCFENVVSNLWKNGLCVRKAIFRKEVQKLRKIKKLKTIPWKRSQSLPDSGDKTSSSCRFLGPHF